MDFQVVVMGPQFGKSHQKSSFSVWFLFIQHTSYVPGLNKAAEWLIKIVWDTASF